MSNKKYSDKEYSDLQKLKQENKNLKKKLSTLRKQLARIDIDQHDNIKDLIDKYAEEEIIQRKEDEIKRLEEKWKCHQCQTGHLKLIILERRDNVFYFRKCDNCSKRTPTKKWEEGIEGLR